MKGHARLTRSVAAIIAAMTLGACSSALKEPEVKLDGIRIGSVGVRIRLALLAGALTLLLTVPVPFRITRSALALT